MAEQTQTKKLENSFVPALLQFRQGQTSMDGAIYLLKRACKEAGLRFVGNKGDVLFGEEIEI